MPPLPVVSGMEARTAFERAGWRFNRQKGSHMVLTKPGHYPLSIPDHDELDRGTLKSLIRVAGMSVDDFYKLLFD
jgi:predicted RNA binding protein YcfA (HicA-like mRNA interferase family)